MKALYEAEHPETKNGQSQALAMNKSLNNNVSAESALTFAQDVATKTNKSERSIQVEVQVATNIPERVQTVIKDLPVADNKADKFIFGQKSKLKTFRRSNVSFDTNLRLTLIFG